MPSNPLVFPDIPRAQLDLALDDLVSKARDVLATQDRLRALLRANQALVELLDLPEVLRRIIEAAVDLVGAQYGALGVISPSGGLEQFIHVGIPTDDAVTIGHLPEGHGLLGALIDDPHPIRLKHLHDDPRSTGFPAHHPAMDSFLGVPIRVRNTVFGNLYLSNQADGEFTAEDEELVQALAATAGFAIDNARLYDETKRRQAWSAASAEVTAAMLSTGYSDSLSILVSRVYTLADADVVTVVVPTGNPNEVVVSVARGLDEERLAGFTFAAAGTLAGSVLEGAQPRLVADGTGSTVVLADGRTMGPVMAVPLIPSGTPEGVMIVSRVLGSAPFTASDLELAADFAGQASVALELIKARGAQERMLLLEDRGRIARDLHDHVIQQLFGTGLELQNLAGSVGSPAAADRIMQSVTNLDTAIAQIRTAIFALSSQGSANRDTIRHKLIDLANDVAPGLKSTPAVSFAGPVDVVVTGALADDVLAVAREGLTNAAKHAGAQRTAVSLQVSAASVELTISDDGRGMPKSQRKSGLANLEVRAQVRGGTLSIQTGPAGTSLVWRVPSPVLDQDPGAR
jgi:signal transduction histidine kinase